MWMDRTIFCLGARYQSNPSTSSIVDLHSPPSRAHSPLLSRLWRRSWTSPSPGCSVVRLACASDLWSLSFPPPKPLALLLRWRIHQQHRVPTADAFRRVSSPFSTFDARICPFEVRSDAYLKSARAAASPARNFRPIAYALTALSGTATPPNALPPASRDIRSSDGLASQIPTLNGVVNSGSVGSAAPNASVNNSLSSVAGNTNEKSTNVSARSAADERGAPGNTRPGADDRSASHPRDDYERPDKGPPSPEQKMLRDRSQDANRQPPPSDSSPYPWSQRRLNFTVAHPNPFPRYGAAVNATASKEGAIYLMGGLINGSTVKGDLWLVEASTPGMACYPVATTSEGPGPRVGHASLLVGNAFIVFGGDTKMDEGDALDDTLYLLNTSTKQWSRALPAGARPPGRYGHTLNILGSKIYIFGGQVEGYFFNDLVAFDLNALQQSSNRWEILIQNTIDGGPPHGQIPPARTNHTMITWGDKLYLFGGTDGIHWFNDVWSYSPHTNSWSQLDCIGYIPSPREGHAAALVGDVMYIFGGRTEEGNDLGDLAAFRITSRRWYTFQNMGPSPSPRSGHSLTTVGKSIVVLAGEPSSAPRDPVELGMAYYLDTSKIRYPPDSTAQAPANNRIEGTRRPSGEKNGAPMASGLRSTGGSLDKPRMGSQDSAIAGSRLPRPGFQQSPLPTSGPAPTPPPQYAPPQPRTNGVPTSRQPTRSQDCAFSPSVEAERPQRFDSNGVASPPPGARELPTTREPRNVISPAMNGESNYSETDEQRNEQQPRRFKPETYQPSQDQSADGVKRSSSRSQRDLAELQTGDRDMISRHSTSNSDQMPKVRQVRRDDHDGPQDSGIGSSPALSQQYDEMAKELDNVKQRNAWYASELAMAKKSGYQSRSADSPVLDERGIDAFADDDKPLIEALLKMRSELARVQDTIDEQSKSAAERIAEMEKQRDTAIHEAVFAKAKLAGQTLDADGKGSIPDTPERTNSINRRLASSLAAQSELSHRIDGLIKDLEAEKRTRELAEDTAEAAQKRVTELEVHRQQHSTELEGLRSELHETQRLHRDISASHAEITGQHQLLTVDKSELSNKLDAALVDTQTHTSLLTALREAVQASAEKAQLLEQKLGEERSDRDVLEQQHRALQTAHDERAGELEKTTRALQDARDVAAKHAHEARTHREAVLAGLGNIVDRSSKSTSAADERVVILQKQTDDANSLVRQNQIAADTAAEKLRRAEERIAGLEAYQEQASREGLGIRKQLQTAMRENHSLTSEKADMEQKFQSQLLESNAILVQHTSLKDILAERGINPLDVRKSRAIDSPSSISKRLSTPDLLRVKDLEQQLEASLKSHDDMKSQFEEINERDEKMKREYEEKLTALDNDHQAAVKYLRGTERMLSKMKQELQRVKSENGEMKKKIERLRDGAESSRSASVAEVTPEWEQEREKLRKEIGDAHATHETSVRALESRLSTLHEELKTQQTQHQQILAAHETSQADLTALQASHSQSRSELERVQQDNRVLEERARDAENKVQLLLDQVEHSVDSYRRQSRLTENATPTLNGSSHTRNLSGASGASALGHIGNLTGDRNSMYSATATEDGDVRNSLALDSLASELDALRNQWETTNKNYRLSDKFDSHEADSESTSSTAGGFESSLHHWRQGLEAAGSGDEGEHGDEAEYKASRPGTGEERRRRGPAGGDDVMNRSNNGASWFSYGPPSPGKTYALLSFCYEISTRSTFPTVRPCLGFTEHLPLSVPHMASGFPAFSCLFDSGPDMRKVESGELTPVSVCFIPFDESIPYEPASTKRMSERAGSFCRLFRSRFQDFALLPASRTHTGSCCHDRGRQFSPLGFKLYPPQLLWPVFAARRDYERRVLPPSSIPFSCRN
nr:tip elongation aberrant protein 1 [Quercus suber]